jgi:hypothetical protein
VIFPISLLDGHDIAIISDAHFVRKNMLTTTVPSQTDEAKKYTVILTEKGWRCTCPDFIFHEKTKRTCKHIIEALEKLESKIKACI